MDQTTATGEPKIALADVHKRFAAAAVLRGVDLEVGDGESVVLIGPSGSGKTVVLKTVVGLERPDRGSVLIAGSQTAGLTTAERERLAGRIGMLFQQSALFDSMPVWENVAFRLLQDGEIGRRRAKEIAVATVESVGLPPDTAELYPVELSGGMQKRVGLARAIADEPSILLLDEPTAGLDPIMSNVINDLILEVAERLGATVLSVTSDMAGARRIADRVAMIYDGRIIWQGPKTALDDSGNPFVDQFVHSRATGPIQMTLD